jgi:sugar lactone lactonase YvrE
LRQDLEAVAQDDNLCGEGPIWDRMHQCLWWSDLSSKLLYRIDATGLMKDTVRLKWMTSGIALNEGGGLVLAGPEGLYLWEGGENYRELFTQEDGEIPSFNDLVADPSGRIYAGTLHLASNGIDVEKPGKLYLIDPRGVSRVVDEGLMISNGLSLSPDNRTLYHVDTGLHRIYGYDVHPQTGELSNKRDFVRTLKEEGVPDGLTVDEEGHVWCAYWFGGKVVRYDPDGAVERSIQFPVRQVSSVAFGGNTLNDLYVTTASERWNSPLAPATFRCSLESCGGSLYRIRLDIRGKHEHQSAFPGHEDRAEGRARSNAI